MTLIENNGDKPASSMTKREAMALAFAVSLSSVHDSEGFWTAATIDVSEYALTKADQLLAQLEKSQ